jgi:hypothetical protein
VEKLVFAVSLTDLVTGPAKRMQKSLLDESKALMQANQSTATLEKSMQGLERAMAKSAVEMNFKAWAKQSDLLKVTKDAYDKADKSGLKMAQSLKVQAAAAGDTAASLQAYTGAVVAAGVAALGLATAIGKAVLAGASFTLAAVQEKQAAQQMFRAMAGGKEAGDQLFEMMETLATQLPQTKTQLTAWSKEFMAMGVLDQSALQNQLRATAGAAALMGESGSDAFVSLSRKIQEAMLSTGKIKLGEKQLAGLAATGVNVADVADAMNMSVKDLTESLKKGTADATKFNDALTGAIIQKGAGPLKQLLGTTEALAAKFKEAIGDMFEDVDIAPFTDAMRDLLSIFSQSTASGQTMKTVFAGFFTSFFKWAGEAVLTAKHFFLGMIIWGLKAYIAIKPWIPLIETLGAVILVAAGLFLFTFAPAVWAGVVALGALIASAAVAAWPFVVMAAVIVGVWEAFQHWTEIKAFVVDLVGSIGTTLSEWAASISTWAGEAASNLINGLVNGISSGAGLVWDAIKGLGTTAMTALKSTLGIASDSKEFIKLGKHTGHGFFTGIGAENDNVRGAGEGLADMAMGGTSSDRVAPAQAPASSGGLTITVEAGAIVIHGATGDAAELTEHALTLVLEKIAIAQGLAA